MESQGSAYWQKQKVAITKIVVPLKFVIVRFGFTVYFGFHTHSFNIQLSIEVN